MEAFMAKTKYKIAQETTSLRTGSKYPTAIHAGEAWHAEHPLVLANPGAFGDEPPVIHPRGWTPPPVVEQASAAPGELRTARRPSNG
jgi:hypothetical protein